MKAVIERLSKVMTLPEVPFSEVVSAKRVTCRLDEEVSPQALANELAEDGLKFLGDPTKIQAAVELVRYHAETVFCVES